MKKILCAVLIAVMLLTFAACKSTATIEFADGDQYSEIGGELNVLNWGEYIDPELIEIFENETGVKVN